MCRGYVLVEGYTERAVIQEVLAPHLADRGIYLSARIVGKPGKKGGDCQFQRRVLPEIRNLILQENDTFVTTFFDYYALPDDWPAWEESRRLNVSLYLEKANVIEAGLKDAVCVKLPRMNPARFIPYIQMYELEALLFADCGIMGDILKVDGNLFQEILDEHDGLCETINDSQTTAPSKRIANIVSSYKKGSSVNAHAWQILKKIGLRRIREQCRHFNEWIQKLERLSSHPIE